MVRGATPLYFVLCWVFFFFLFDQICESYFRCRSSLIVILYATIALHEQSEHFMYASNYPKFFTIKFHSTMPLEAGSSVLYLFNQTQIMYNYNSNNNNHHHNSNDNNDKLIQRQNSRFFLLFFFFFFFCVPQLYLWGSPLLGEIFAYVTVF